jgi:sugar O-acyltransferase (sialic acid O-acetyltransferase NeuD family)
MITKLLILGAGGTSRDLAGVIHDINQSKRRWKLLGFLDDDAAKQGTRIDGLPVLGPIDAARDFEKAQFIIGIARWPAASLRPKIAGRLALPRQRYATIVHPSATVYPGVKVGAGTAIMHNVVITTGTEIGDHVLIHQNVTMGHDQVVEDFVTIAPGATIGCEARLKRGCYIGAASAIRHEVTVHEGALVGLGSVVVKDVPVGRTVMGNPAKLLDKKRR